MQIYGNDEGKFVTRVIFTQGMASYPYSEIVIDDSNGLYEGLVNAGVIEYDVSGIRYDGMSSGPITPEILIINRIMGNGVYDLNKLEKFEAFWFE
jgi:hypothetical protein